ncbi:MAG: ribonuclease R [Micavibrio aeruginosavorus]|nr:ribonuclease R [Micavibrio aeruginosavorus]
MKHKSLSGEDVLRLLSSSPVPLTKREMVQAFNLKGEEQRMILKVALRDLEKAGKIAKLPGQAYAIPDALPEIGIVTVIEIDVDGDVLAEPVEWDFEEKGAPPRIEIQPGGKGHPALEEGDRALVRFSRIDKDLYQASVIRPVDSESGRVLGLVVRHKAGYLLHPTDRRAKTDFDIPENALGNAKEGDLAIGEIQPGRGLQRKKVRIREVIGQQTDPKAISLIALHEAGLRIPFPEKVVRETDGMIVPPLGAREDLRGYPLVTIDGPDARDFDDAVYATRDGDGFHLIVAIADVAFYVRPGTALDDEAYRRGNSTYFPDRVVPMLPEALSNDLCSLRPHEDRACLAAHMWIDRNGNMNRHKFVRGLMKSRARLIYEQVQAAQDGLTDEITGPLMNDVICPLYDAYKILLEAREKRGALDLDIPERKILLNDKGEMIGVKPRARLESHKLIEEFMILANVAAAQALEAKRAPCVYRVHDRPSPEKLDNVREFIESFGLSLPKGQVTQPRQINDLLKKADTLEYGHLVHEMLLRAQMQAHYSPENLGHFGLALQRYAHFTSPIRRYADLLVHRSMIRAWGLGDGAMSDEETVQLEEMSDHISQTERISAEAERNAVDRFAAAYLSTKTGAIFSGRISGVTRFGLFVKLEESGADGLVPIRSLPQDYYIHDERQHALIGRSNGLVYRLGASVQVALMEAEPLTGSMIFEIMGKGADIPGLTLNLPPQQPGRGPRGRPRRDGKTGPGKGRISGKKGPRDGKKGRKR